jgi:hypothetical protein
MNDIPVFAVKDARGFYDQLVAMKPDPKTGKPDPVNIKAFLEAHPESVRAMVVISTHIPAVEMEKVEGEIDQPRGRAGIGCRLHRSERRHAIRPYRAKLAIDIGAIGV